MLLMPEWATAPVLVAALFGRCALGALSVTPSTSWYGDDGSWSAVSLRVGTPPQWVDLMVSTASAEIWVVGTGGCKGNPTCSTERGGVFNSNASSTWSTLGFYELGLDTKLGLGGYGYYGFDDITFGTTGVYLYSAAVASINTTEYWLGFLGLGNVPGNFTNTTIASTIALLQSDYDVQGRSYGYTAGAQYQLKGEPCSLTIGGYDANRFVPHNLTFSLDLTQQPVTYINSVVVASSLDSTALSSPVELLNAADKVYATIDSSTPYLWFPTSVCDRFATALNLTYNSTLNLYTFDSNPNQHDILTDSQLTFTFSLSDFSSPQATDIVNITLPYAAFDLQLTYPAIPNTSLGSNDSTKLYFPLRRAANESQYTIGRAFLQEAYLITDYDRHTFSVHQAVHTVDPIANTSITTIISPYESQYYADWGYSAGLSTAAKAGIAVGVVIFVVLLGLLAFFLIRRRRRRLANEKGVPFSSPRRRSGRRVLSKPLPFKGYSTENSNADDAQFDDIPPLPRDIHSDANTLSGTTEAGASSQGLSAYEGARRKAEHQQGSSQQSSPHLPQTPYHAGKNNSDSSFGSQQQLSNTTYVESTRSIAPLSINTTQLPITRKAVPGTTSPILPPYQEASSSQSRRAPDTVRSLAVGDRSLGSSTDRQSQALYGDGDTIESGDNSEHGPILTQEDQREIDGSKFLREDIQKLRSTMQHRGDQKILIS
ncbi:aspartic peptidase domain-containing protein [Xylogone sp. PMI_703]|nr:aspartic peptidase domain-containing protein [Xylogone sp. PMI_703]